MADEEQVLRGIFALPNEILLSIFSLFPTRSLLPFTPTCQQFHSLILRVVHQRLQIAAGLNAYTMFLECHPPSARLTAAKFFCTSLGTDGLPELLVEDENDVTCVGKVKKLGEMYSRFRPQRKEPDIQAPMRHPAGDVPGSRTHPDTDAAPGPSRSQDNDVVSETVTVDAQDLFSQLTTLVYLGKREPRRGMLFCIQEVSEGTIRVWRKWLADQCESKRWTDGEVVPVHHETPGSATSGNGKARADSVTGPAQPTKDPSILWINTRDDNVGIKFRVKERNRRQATPLLYTSDVDVAVSYEVVFEEILVRTTHLLLTLEEAQKQVDNHSGKAIVFGSYAGIQEFDTAGHPRR
ncbi:hypothetical protein LTR08_004920 [Meristemomyces frigidus]|nr:hypothetical protein LTR08_004920 [Meristemomyces frigidus]